MARRRKLDIMAAHRSPEDYHRVAESNRQISYEDRVIESILRWGGAVAAELKQMRDMCTGDRQGDLTFAWFNEYSQFPAMLLSRKLSGDLTFAKEIASMMGTRFDKTATFRAFLDVIDSYPDQQRLGFITKYQGVGRDLVLHNCRFVSQLEGEFYFVRRHEDQDYFLQPLEYFVAGALSEWERPHYYDDKLTDDEWEE